MIINTLGEVLFFQGLDTSSSFHAARHLAQGSLGSGGTELGVGQAVHEDVHTCGSTLRPSSQMLQTNGTEYNSKT